MIVRILLLSLAALLAACASAPQKAPLTAIEVVYHEQTMFYSIEDGGRARLVGADNQREFAFDASHEDFRRIADLLAPLEAEGLPCANPFPGMSAGYIVFRRGEAEQRVAMVTNCNDPGERPLSRNTNQAWRAMGEMGRARYVAPTIPEPAIIAVERMYWGSPTSGWSVSAAGEGRYTERGALVQAFTVTPEAFAQVRDIFRPYESRHFECRRTITDGPYGHVIWSSREGQADQRTVFDAGCVTGDADDLFARLDRADALVRQLRGAPAP